MAVSKGKGNMGNILLNIPVWEFAWVTVSLPGLSLAVCFITAFIFSHEDVTETMCQVKNYIPSVSAVTGIAPQAYLWRTCVALHSAPRFAVAVMYYNQHMSRIHHIPVQWRLVFSRLVKLNFWLNVVEDSCLVLVTYISNRENYPVHEKIFVGFMVCSIAYILLNTILFKWTRGDTMTPLEQRSYWWKRAMLATISLATLGLIFFFIQHRVYCVVGAFSLFSICEYFIAYSNMGYHFSAFLDFKGKYLLFGEYTSDDSVTNGTEAPVTNNNRLKQKQR